MRNIDELSQMVVTIMNGYVDHYDIDYSSEWLMIKMQEEFGELAEAFLDRAKQNRPREKEVGRKRRFAHELADVFALLLLLAEKEGVDIPEAVEQKWGKYKHGQS